MKIIKFPRDFGIKKAGKFYNAAIKVMDKGPNCVLDFSQVRHIDLSAAQVVLALERECERKGGRLELRNTDESAARLLRLAGLKRCP
ncbi:MAG: hypothetical protein A2W19_09045 [Spirochaetes bacterium RBG_16_49_21]|nr:MAG: hypothetical protein A2W19_09045 [Spirochaetes bacterium RBG_16_49_21]